MRQALSLAITFALITSASCKKDEDKQKTKAKPTPTKPTPPKPVEPKPTAVESPGMVNKMANCPTAVGSATILVKEGDDKVTITITHTEPNAIAEIKKRAKHLSEVSGKKPGKIEHTGKGTGGGALGKCPVVMNETTLKVAQEAKGVTIELTPRGAGKLSDLANEVEKRWNAMKAGGGPGGHGSGTGGGQGGGGSKGGGDKDSKKAGAKKTGA